MTKFWIVKQIFDRETYNFMDVPYLPLTGLSHCNFGQNNYLFNETSKLVGALWNYKIVAVAVCQKSPAKLMSISTSPSPAQIATTAHQNVIVLARQFHYGIKYITVRYPHMNLKLPKRYYVSSFDNRCRGNGDVTLFPISTLYPRIICWKLLTVLSSTTQQFFTLTCQHLITQL